MDILYFLTRQSGSYLLLPVLLLLRRSIRSFCHLLEFIKNDSKILVVAPVDIKLFFKGDVQDKLSSLTEKERASREECVTLRSSVASLEGKLSQIQHEFELNTTKLEQERTEHTIATNDLNR